jgi:hypothetical protein
VPRFVCKKIICINDNKPHNIDSQSVGDYVDIWNSLQYYGIEYHSRIFLSPMFCVCIGLKTMTKDRNKM